MTHHVILGAGPAGVIAAETIRKHAPNDRITLVGDEAEPPYSRMAIPYLLIGNIDERGTYLRKNDQHFEQLCVEQVHTRAVSIDSKAKTIQLDNGQALKFDKLLIATGSRPVRPPIPGMDSPQVHPCWTLEDARAIMALAKPGARVVQMGAGFIGCIIMEALAARGVTLFVVEMGDTDEYGTFAKFQDAVLSGKVISDEADGYTRHIAYERGDRQLDMRWHCYTEEYAARRIGGRDDPWICYAQSPEFAVNNSGRAAVKGATLQSVPGKTWWLLACDPSRTWVAYQANPDMELPLTLECPAGRLTCERFPLGKVAVVQSSDGGVLLDADAESAVLRFESQAAQVRLRLNGKAREMTRDAGGVWSASGK